MSTTGYAYATLGRCISGLANNSAKQAGWRGDRSTSYFDHKHIPYSVVNGAPQREHLL